MTYHFQKIIRGRIIKNEPQFKIWVITSTLVMMLIYISFYIKVVYNMDKNESIYDEYFLIIQKRCHGVNLIDKNYFFYSHSNLKMGYIFAYFGVYFGALKRHQDHGLVRRDYT